MPEAVCRIRRRPDWLFIATIALPCALAAFAAWLDLGARRPTLSLVFLLAALVTLFAGIGALVMRPPNAH